MDRATIIREGKYLLWVCCATLWIALFVVLPDFWDNPFSGFKGVITLLVYITAVSIVSFGVIYLFGLNKYVAAVTVPLYGTLGAAVSFYRVMYRVTITPLMLDCIFHTNMEEAMGVVSWQLIGWMVLNVLIAVAFVIWRWRQGAVSRSWLRAAVCLLFIGVYYHANGRLHDSLNQRYPMNIMESGRQYGQLQRLRKANRTIPDYIQGSAIDSLDIIVVVGESLRSDHLQLNGYARETNPLLSRRRNLLSFPHVRSLYTHTAASVPALMTRADSLHPEYQYNETSFITILKQKGFHTAWISNQDISESFATFPMECDTTVFANFGKSVYVFSGWYDEELLEPLKDWLRLDYPKNLILLHTIGSHWYYNNHVPEQHYYFQPITDNRVVTNNTLEQVVNSYDNTVRYCDFVVDSVIRCVEDRCAVVIYLSDHGESLGENNNFLHANGAFEQTLCACVIWYSDIFAKQFPNKINALHENQYKSYYTDFLFHSVLGITNMATLEDHLHNNIFCVINE